MFSGSRRAAIGSILLRSPGSSNPLQYSFKGACRSWCPAAVARPSIYAAKRLSCGPGAERRDPTKQFYIKMLFYDPVVLGGTLFLIEEPENHLHPKLFETLVTLLRQVQQEVTSRGVP